MPSDDFGMPTNPFTDIGNPQVLTNNELYLLLYELDLVPAVLTEDRLDELVTNVNTLIRSRVEVQPPQILSFDEFQSAQNQLTADARELVEDLDRGYRRYFAGAIATETGKSGQGVQYVPENIGNLPLADLQSILEKAKDKQSFFEMTLSDGSDLRLVSVDESPSTEFTDQAISEDELEALYEKASEELNDQLGSLALYPQIAERFGPGFSALDGDLADLGFLLGATVTESSYAEYVGNQFNNASLVLGLAGLEWNSELGEFRGRDNTMLPESELEEIDGILDAIADSFPGRSMTFRRTYEYGSGRYTLSLNEEQVNTVQSLTGLPSRKFDPFMDRIVSNAGRHGVEWGLVLAASLPGTQPFPQIRDTRPVSETEGLVMADGFPAAADAGSFLSMHRNPLPGQRIAALTQEYGGSTGLAMLAYFGGRELVQALQQGQVPDPEAARRAREGLTKSGLLDPQLRGLLNINLTTTEQLQLEQFATDQLSFAIARPDPEMLLESIRASNDTLLLGFSDEEMQKVLSGATNTIVAGLRRANQSTNPFAATYGQDYDQVDPSTSIRNVVKNTERYQELFENKPDGMTDVSWAQTLLAKANAFLGLQGEGGADLARMGLRAGSQEAVVSGGVAYHGLGTANRGRLANMSLDMRRRRL